MRVRVGRAAAALTAILFSLPALASESGPERATYRLTGRDAELFAPYANAGYRLEVTTTPVGESTARVSIQSPADRGSAPFPLTAAALPAEIRAYLAIDDPTLRSLALRLTARSRTVADAQHAILGWVAANVAYEDDRERSQDPLDVLRSRRAHCVGFSELSVALLRAAGLPARNVSGVWVETRAEVRDRQRSVPENAGIYHRWVEIYDPASGWIFADAIRRLDFVTARYLPFAVRPEKAPASLRILPIVEVGDVPARRVGQDPRGRPVWARGVAAAVAEGGQR